MKKYSIIFTMLFSLFICLNGSVSADTDVVFVMDGSGSISSTDFQIQKDGIAGALNNALVVPRNGSIAAALVQFGGSSTRIDVPFTIINDETDIASMISQVNSINQIRSSTNVGDGINRATSVINSSGRNDATQSFCLSTDGLRNRGATVSSALAIARIAAINLDQFSVIAIEDPPHYYESDFHNAYDQHVFGGGVVSVVQNAAEFATTVGATCFPKNLELVGLEVVQTIQDWQNSVSLIEDKTTYVRAHIQTIDADPVDAVARLRGFRNGTELSGSPLTPINTGGKIVARQNAADRRGDWDDSLNFRLPLSWLNGTVELHLEAVGGGMSFLEPEEEGGTANDSIVQVTFDEVETLEVRFIPIKWTDSSGIEYPPTSGDIIWHMRRILAIYPISNLDWDMAPEVDWPTIGRPTLGAVNTNLEAIRASDNCNTGCERLYYGILVGNTSAAGLANNIPGTVASGDIGSINSEPNVPAHELGHTLNRHHSTDSSNPHPTIPSYKGGPCGSWSLSTAPDFPYMFEVNGVDRATIGPMEIGQNSLIWGLDTSDPVSISTIDPEQNFDLMSYCSPLWISDVTFEGLLNNINQRYPSQPPVSTGSNFEYNIIRGSVDFVNNTINFLPPYSITTETIIPLPSSGNYSLELIDENGGSIGTIHFEPNIYTGFAEDPGLGSFIIPVIKDETVNQINVVNEGQIFDSIIASPNTPSVTVNYPNGGEYIVSSEVIISWEGYDIDNDILSYSVQYSANAGSTWETLAVDLNATTLSVPISDLKQSNSALIKISASDGFHVAEDQSDSFFSIPNNPPQLLLVSPGENDFFAGVQSITLEVEAIDREDGELEGASLQWSSNLNGSLGSGKFVMVDASQLFEGNHTITIRATDSGGLESVTTVRINVFRVAPQPVTGDIDGDYDVDRDDLRIILEARNTPATGDGDPRDIDGDGMITALDARKLVTMCTRPRCATE